MYLRHVISQVTLQIVNLATKQTRKRHIHMFIHMNLHAFPTAILSITHHTCKLGCVYFLVDIQVVLTRERLRTDLTREDNGKMRLVAVHL